MSTQKFVKHSIRGGSIVGISVALQFIIALVVQVILTRQLEPSLFGQVAFASAVGMFLNSFTNTAGDMFVIQSKDNPEEKLNNIFTLELVLASFFFIFVFVFSPFVMNLFDKSDSIILVQILAFSYFYNPMSRPRCIFERDLAFFRAKVPLICSQILCAIITVALAYAGFGIWSLIFWRLGVLTFEVLILWLIASYLPKFAWNPEVIKSVFKFGWPLMIAGFLAFFVQNISYVIIGSLEDADTQSGYFWLALQFSFYFLKVREIIYSVLFPVFSQVMESESKARIFEKVTKAVTGVFLVPTLVVVFFGYELITLVFSEKWGLSVFPFQVIFIAMLIRGVNSNVAFYLHSEGKLKVSLAGVILRLSFFLPIGYFLAQKYGINGLSVAILIVDFIVAYFVYEFFIKPLTGKGFIYFFFVPALLSGVTFFLMLIALENDLSSISRICIFILILITTYFLALREPLKDISRGMEVFRKTR